MLSASFEPHSPMEDDRIGKQIAIIDGPYQWVAESEVLFTSESVL